MSASLRWDACKQPMTRKFVSLLLFIGLVFCQNSGANKVELSEPELSNIASESIKESMKKSKMRSWKIERNNFINNYSDIGDIAEGKSGGISYQDLSSIYNNELAAIAAKISIDKNNKINSPARSLMVNLFKYSAGISLTLMAVETEFYPIGFAGFGAMMFINTKNKFSFDKEKEKYLNGLSKSQIIQFSQIYDPIIEDYKQTYGQNVKKNQLINKKLNIITGCIAGGILASGIILIAIGNIQIPS